MNWTDYIIIGVLGLSVMVGIWRGLVSEVLALAIWVAAFWVAWLFGPAVASHLEHKIDLPSARILVGYGVCFVSVLIAGALLRYFIGKLIQSTGLSGTDRLLGMLFGFARGVLLVTVLVFVIGLTAFTRDAWWQQSVLLPQFQHLAAWLGQRIPPGLGDHLKPSLVLDHLPRLPLTVPTGLPSAASVLAPTPAPATSADLPAAAATTGYVEPR